MGERVVIAIMDTGCDLSHPDLAPNAWSNKGEIAGNGIDDDGNGFVDDVHGWCALIVAAGNAGTASATRPQYYPVLHSMQMQMQQPS